VIVDPLAQGVGEHFASMLSTVAASSLFIGAVVGYVASLLIHGLPDHWRK
jgi:hypothetical protein